ncbi:ornithine cyclodeaminase family protein [Amorphus orientalis]|uniref:Ornithine cyclodeaminase n=1 Tax=Amorphus orientalis TaxID=649198 RepID=A0AAE3VMG5_9HYPH|nr:ornithine cyclodeaminase [Amorphus orientalis]MDQ0314746.1 ornithine cyclodeaminase [Amorphus orientalis]
MRIVSAADINDSLAWKPLVAALKAAHATGGAELGDTLLTSNGRKFLVRSAWLGGLGAGVKAVTVYPDNPASSPARPSVQGSMLVFDEATGEPAALVDGVALTAWKTAADSALGADLLARPDIASMLMVGAGNMAEPLIRAHCAVRPSLSRVTIHNRTRARADALAERLTDLGVEIRVTEDLDAAIPEADLVTTATMSEKPVLKGELLRPGTHVDLVGAFTPTMREADDAVLTRGRLFVDCRKTTIGEIGELIDPMERGVISEADVIADYFDLAGGAAGRASADEITVCKNGGGAHLDLMVARHVLDQGVGSEV